MRGGGGRAGGGSGARVLAAGLALALLLGLMMILRRQAWDLRREARDPAAALSQVLTAGERIAASLLGGFRPVLINILWVRIQLHVEKGRYLELPFLYQALQELQGDSPALYRVEARNMMLDIPRVLADRPRERWEWILRGMEVLRRGRDRFPQDPEMVAECGILYHFRFHPLRSPEDRARFLADGEVNPRGADPLAIARGFLEEAGELPGHTLTSDLVLRDVLRFQLVFLFEGDPPRLRERERLGEALALLDRIRRIHRHLEVHLPPDQPESAALVRRLAAQLEEVEEALREAGSAGSGDR